MRRRTEDRRRGFVAAAGKLFIERGYGAVTMEAIAAQAGASKATLYGYFPSKETLFEAFVNEAGRGGLEGILAVAPTADVAATLQRLGMAYLDLVTRPEVIDVNRLIMGEAGRQPQLSRIFFENGPRKILVAIGQTLQALMDAGHLRRTDLRQASLWFKALCEAGLVERQLWGLDAPPDAHTREQAVAHASAVFLAAFASMPADR